MIPGLLLEDGECWRAPYGWQPTAEMLATLCGVVLTHEPGVRARAADSYVPLSVILGAFPPARALEVLRTLGWLSYQKSLVELPHGCTDATDVHVRDMSRLVRQVNEFVSNREADMTRETQRAAELLEEARRLLITDKNPAGALPALMEAAEIAKNAQAPILNALARSLAARAHAAMGNQAQALAIGTGVLKELRDHGLVSEAMTLDRVLSLEAGVPAAAGIPPVPPVGEGLAEGPKVDTDASWEPSLEGMPDNPKLLEGLKQLREAEAKLPGVWKSTSFDALASPNGDPNYRAVGKALGGKRGWTPVAQWLRSTEVALDRPGKKLFLDTDRLGALIAKLEQAPRLVTAPAVPTLPEGMPFPSSCVLPALKALQEVEESRGYAPYSSDLFADPSSARLGRKLVRAADGGANWTRIADWLVEANVASENLCGDGTVGVDRGRLGAMIEQIEAAQLAAAATETGNPVTLGGVADSREERSLAMAVKEKIVGAATNTGLGAVEAFKEGLAISGSQQVSDRLVKLFHERLGHHIPLASTPLGQQAERFLIPAFIHMLASVMPEKVPGAEIVQSVCMRAITGVAKDDGDALIGAVLPLLGEVVRMGTAEGGLDLFSMAMGSASASPQMVGQPAQQALAPQSQASALSDVLARQLEQAKEGEEVVISIKKKAAEVAPVVPPFEANPTR